MRHRRPIYLDNHATTKPDPRVVEAMIPYLTEEYGNASSRVHEYGVRAAAAVRRARGQVAALVGARPSEIVFTGGATESINLALKGALEAAGPSKDHVVSVCTEHRAVLDVCAALARRGIHVTLLPVDSFGLVDPEAVADAMTPRTALVSVMLANNEIGTIHPLDAIGELCRRRGVLLHTDATQAAGRLPIAVDDLRVDLLSLSAHKMHGPQGVGALYVRHGAAGNTVVAQIDGGGHEDGLRSGTLNVPGIVGFGVAAEIAVTQGEEDAARMRTYRDMLVQGLLREPGDVRLNGHPVHRLPNNASVTFQGAGADDVMMRLPDLAVSSGSACSSLTPRPSHVLTAIGLSPEEIRSTLRIGLSRFTTTDEIDRALRRIAEAVRAVRGRRTAQVSAFEHHPTHQPE